MGLINLYNTISNKHSVINGKGKIKDLLSDADSYLLIQEGNRISSDYELQENDVIYARRLPKGQSSQMPNNTTGEKSSTLGNTWDGIKSGIKKVGSTIASWFGGKTGGEVSDGTISWGSGTKTAQEKQQEELEAAQQDAQRRATELAQQIDQLPFLRGASNKTALGNAIPFVCGEIYNTPMLINGGYYSIEGTNGVNQYYNASLLCGYNHKLTTIKAGEDTLLTLLPNVSQDGTYDVTHSNYSGSKIEVRNSGEMTLIGAQKCVGTVYNTEVSIDDDEDEGILEETCSANTMKVEVCIKFDGLRMWDDDSGTWVSRGLEIVPQWTNVDDPDDDDWNTFYFSGQQMKKKVISLIPPVVEDIPNTFLYNTKETIRFTAVKEFTAAECYGKTIKIRLVRKTPKVTDVSANEDAVLLYTNCFCYDAKTSSSSELKPCYSLINPFRDWTTRLGIKILANDSLNNTNLNELNCISYGLARTYDASTNTWSSSKTTTRNPASWILEILTSNYHRLSKYYDSEIDLNSLGSLYTYCEENELYCDNLITTGTKKASIISDILGTLDAVMFINDDGLFEFAIDKKENTPVALINCQNVKSITYNKDLSRKVTGAKITYTNRESWNVENEYIMIDGDDYDQSSDTIQEVSPSYITTHNHAWKYTQKLLRKSVLEPRTITVDVGLEGDYYPLFSTVLLQLEQLKQGICSSVIREVVLDDSGYITDIIIADYVDFVDGYSYGVIIQAQSKNGKQLFYKAVTGTDRTKTLHFSEPIVSSSYDVIPSISNIVSFGLLNEDGTFTKITNTMKIYGISPSSNNGWQLTLRDYNEEVYNYGKIPDYKSNITAVPKNRAERQLTKSDVTDATEKVLITTYANLSKLFNTQQITLYRESATVLTSDDLPTSVLTYDFKTMTPSWNDSDEGYPLLSNGWTWTYPTDAENTVYVTQGTAQSQAQTATIQPSSWATPVPSGQNGTNGMNSYTVTLYVRTSDQPQFLPSELTYNFISGALTGTRNGWMISMPKVDDEGNPCWEIHATALSESSTDIIEPSEWSTPIQITSDGISVNEVKEIVKEEMSDVVETPNIYGDYQSATILITNKGITPRQEEFSVTLHAVQTNEELDFTFLTEKFNLPDGWSYSIDYHTITFRVPEGTKVTSGSFLIPISYRTFKYNNLIAYTEDNVEYQLTSDGTPLGYNVMYDDATEYDYGFVYSGVNSGTNRGVVTSIENIPTGLIIGDYFTWVGEDTASELVQGGQFAQCGIYYYIGTSSSWQWEQDSDPDHLASSLSGVLSVSDADLETNNSQAYEYLSHLTANTIFAKMIVANEAFITELTADEAFMEKLTATSIEIKGSGFVKSTNYDAKTSGMKIDSDGNADFNGTTHIGGKTTIGGETTIGGTTIINDDLNVNGDFTLEGTIKTTNYSQYASGLSIDKNGNIGSNSIDNAGSFITRKGLGLGGLSLIQNSYTSIASLVNGLRIDGLGSLSMTSGIVMGSFSFKTSSSIINVRPIYLDQQILIYPVSTHNDYLYCEINNSVAGIFHLNTYELESISGTTYGTVSLWAGYVRL